MFFVLNVVPAGGYVAKYLSRLFVISLSISLAAFYPSLANGNYFNTTFLRNLKLTPGSITVADLLGVRPQELRFFCAAGPYATPLPILQKHAQDGDDLKSLERLVHKELSIGPSDSYLILVTNSGAAVLPFARWRILILEQSDYFCDTNLDRPIKFHAIGWLWLNRFNSD